MPFDKHSDVYTKKTKQNKNAKTQPTKKIKKSSKAAEINLQDVNWFVMCFAKKTIIIMKKR